MIDKEDVFVYLDKLRESGATNMYGATPYITAEFNVDSSTATVLLIEWMRTFSERHKRDVN